MQEMIANTRYPSWEWDPANGIPPDLPAQSHDRTPAAAPTSNGEPAAQPAAAGVAAAESEKHEAAPSPQA
jgi:hypothetical protein